MSLPFDHSPPPCSGECGVCDLDCDLLDCLILKEDTDKTIKTIRRYMKFMELEDIKNQIEISELEIIEIEIEERITDADLDIEIKDLEDKEKVK